MVADRIFLCAYARTTHQRLYADQAARVGHHASAAAAAAVAARVGFVPPSGLAQRTCRVGEVQNRRREGGDEEMHPWMGEGGGKYVW